MSYTKELLENDRVKFTVEVEEAQWKDALNEAYLKNKGKFTIPGFRKGHAPRSFIERAYGNGVFFDEALDIVLPKSYDAILDAEADLFPVDRPEVSIQAISDSTLKYTAEVQLKPTVTLGQYTGLEFVKDKATVTKEEVNSEINAARESAGWWEEITDRAAQTGDKVKIDYSGNVDGVKFEGGTAEGYELTLGSNTFIPGFEDGVVGMTLNENKDVEVTFPEQYHAENLAGKKAVFNVTLHTISVKKLPELDDEFAKDVSDKDTFKEYEADVKAKIKERKTKAADRKLEQDIINKISENATINIPQCMIDNEADDMVQEFGYRLSYQGLDMESYLKYSGLTREKLADNYKDQAAKTVRARLTMEAIIKEAKLEISDKDTDAVLKEMADKENKTLEEYKKDFNEHYMSYVRNDAMNRKLIDYLKANNTVK